MPCCGRVREVGSLVGTATTQRRSSGTQAGRSYHLVSAVLALPELKNVLSKAGLEADASSPAELRELVQKDYARWGVVIRKNNITAD